MSDGTKEFTFDVTLLSVVRVRASSQEAAARALADFLYVEVDVQDGPVTLTEVSHQSHTFVRED
jgi:hypothetical protein